MIPRPLRPARDSVFMFAQCVGPGSFSAPSRNIVKGNLNAKASLQPFVAIFDISCP